MILLQDHVNLLQDHVTSVQDHLNLLQDHATSVQDHVSLLQGHVISIHPSFSNVTFFSHYKTGTPGTENSGHNKGVTAYS